MAAKKPAAKDAQKTGEVFTAEERAAMRERAQERRARPRGPKLEGEPDVLAKIAAMEPADRVVAQRLHAIVKAHAPSLGSKTWYGMPAYTKDGEIICFLQPSGKFKVRYSTLGFSDEAKLDEGNLWPTAFALTELGPTEETKIVALLKKAMG